MEQEKGIQYFPIALFSSVMGVAGVAISIRLMEEAQGWNHTISIIIMLLATAMFIVNGAIVIYRLVKFRDDVKADFNHPVKMNFFGTISISLLLLALLYYNISIGFSFILWILGVLLQVWLTLAILSKLIWEKEFQLAQFNPTWFIPIVGNIVVPLAGVFHADLIINWVFFSIGVVFTIVYLTIFINRIFFQPALPPPLTPTLFILLAPPGIGVVSYLKLVGEIDAFVYIVYGVAFYIGLLFVYQIKRFFTIPFFVSWWAYLFPSAAMTNATMHIYHETGIIYIYFLFVIQFVALIILTLILFWKTIGMLINKKLFVKEG